MQKMRTFKTIIEYKKQNALTKKTIRNAKRDYWIKAAEKDNLLDAYKRAKRYRKNNFNTQLMDDNGIV